MVYSHSACSGWWKKPYISLWNLRAGMIQTCLQYCANGQARVMLSCTYFPYLWVMSKFPSSSWSLFKLGAAVYKFCANFTSLLLRGQWCSAQQNGCMKLKKDTGNFSNQCSILPPRVSFLVTLKLIRTWPSADQTYSSGRAWELVGKLAQLTVLHLRAKATNCFLADTS